MTTYEVATHEKRYDDLWTFWPHGSPLGADVVRKSEKWPSAQLLSAATRDLRG